MPKKREPISKKGMLIYLLGIILFVFLANFFNNFERTTETPLSDTANANTQWVLERIEADPQSGDGVVCAAVPDTARRLQVGWPFMLYEQAREVSCGRSSGRSENKDNQLYNTLVAAGVATTAVIIPNVVMRSRKES